MTGSPHIPYRQARLANGLNVLVHRDDTLPWVGVNLWYHVGSRNERPGRTGFAHLFEHILFEGSAHAPRGAYDDLLEAAGGVSNGSTDPDRTNYWADIPPGALDLVLWLESDRMGWLLESMGREKLDLQRSVVKNERRESYENQPYGLAFETLQAALYPPDHPYHWPTIGSMEDLDAAGLDDVEAFFRTYYAPNNASLALAGDLDPDRVLERVEAWFGEVPEGPPIPPVRLPEVGLDGERRLTLPDDVQLPRLYMAWHSVPLFTPGDAALEVLSSVLTRGKGSRLYRRLVYDDRLAQDVSAFQDGGEAGGAFHVIATARPGVGLAELHGCVREEIERVAAEGIGEEELQRALAQVEADFWQSLERVGGFGGKADRLNEYHFLAGDPGYLPRDLARFRAVEPADVQEQARRRLVEAPGVVLGVVPRGRRDLAVEGGEEGGAVEAGPVSAPGEHAGPGIRSPELPPEAYLARDRKPPASAASPVDRTRPPDVGPPRSVALPRVEELRLENGLRVVLLSRPGVPVVVADLHVRGGAGALPPDKAGLAALAADMLDEGAGIMSATEISDAVESLGASLRTATAWDADGIRLRTPSPGLSRGLELLADVALRPSFPEKELRRVRDERLTRILQELDEPSALAGKALAEVLYGPEEPYGRPILGTGDTVRGLGREDVVAYYRRWYRPGNAVLLLAGDVDRETVGPLLESRFGCWDPAPPPSEPSAPRPRERTALEVHLVDRPGAPQSEIQVGRIGVERRTRDYFPLVVLNTVLGGAFTSRLNRALREEKGFTYGAGSYFAMRKWAGPFVARAAVHTPVTAEAVAEFLAQLAALREESVPEEELVRARNYVAYRLPQRFQSAGQLADRAAELVLYDLPWDYYDRYVERIQAVNAEEVLRVARKYLDPATMAVVVAGDREAVEGPLERLGLGPVRVRPAPGSGAPSLEEARDTAGVPPHRNT